MLRKKLAISLLAVAQMVILGHGVVPHYHHADLSGDKPHYHGADAEHEHPDETPLGLAFSDFVHLGEHITFTNTNTAGFGVTKDAMKIPKALLRDFRDPSGYIVDDHQHTFLLNRQKNYRSSQDGIHKLRGPPVFIVA